MGIQDDLVDGIYEIYSVLREEDIEFYQFDPANTPNIYDELINKTYLPPVILLGKVEYVLFESTETAKGDYFKAVITVPKKSFDLAGILVDISTVDEISKGKFTYQGKSYLIDKAEFGSNLKSVTTKFKFTCSEVY